MATVNLTLYPESNVEKKFAIVARIVTKGVHDDYVRVSEWFFWKKYKKLHSVLQAWSHFKKEIVGGYSGRCSKRRIHIWQYKIEHVYYIK